MGTGAYRPPISKARCCPNLSTFPELAVPFGVAHDEAPSEIQDSLKKPRAKSQDPKLDTTKILAPLFRVNR